MTRTTYAYDDPGGRAALHLVGNTPLADVVTQTATVWAGQDAMRLELDTPRPSEDERVLWELCLDFTGKALNDLTDLRSHADRDCLRVAVEAMAIAFGLVDDMEGVEVPC